MGAMRNKIFINYRREGTTETAGRLYDRLAQVFGHENLFVDFLGADLKARLNNQLPMCQAFLTVIGPSWLDAKDEAGQHRIHSPDDFVAAEIAAALKRHPRVRDAVVLAFPDRLSGTGLYAFVEANATEDELLKFLGEAKPEHLQVVQNLPRNKQGEIRSEILELVAMNQLDLIDTLIGTEAERAIVSRIVSGRRNLRDRFTF